MTVRSDVQEGLDRWRVGEPFTSWGPRLAVAPGPVFRGRRITCEVHVTMPDRDTGEPFTTSRAFVVQHGTDPATWGPAIVAALDDLLLHEAREALTLDLSRPFDPHARTRR